MRRKLFGTCGLLIISAGISSAQSLAEMNATMGAADTLATQGSVAGGQVALDRARGLQQQPGVAAGMAGAGGVTAQTAPGAAPGLPPPGGGFAPAPAAGLPAAFPGAPVAPGAPGAPGALPGAPGVPTLPGADGGVPGGIDPLTGAPLGGQPGQPGTAQLTPTPEPTIKVLIGRRVYDAVTGALLEDAFQQTVVQSEQDKYLDDGMHDNGIAGDGIRGSVETVKDKYIGAETNSLKNRLINLVRNSENLTPMVFYGFHVMAVDPTTQHRAMPNLLEKEAQRDETLRDWNNKFLADYRVDKNDPRSEYYQLFVPSPPLFPQFPVPPGYVAPQKLAPGQNPAQVTGQPNIYNGDPLINVPGNEMAI